MFPKTVKVLFADTASFAGYHHERFELVAIVPFAGNEPPSPPPPAENKITEACVRIVRNVHQYYDVNLFIGTSSTGGADDMARLFTEAARAVELCSFSEKDFVHGYDRDETPLSGAPPRISYERLGAFYRGKSGRRDARIHTKCFPQAP